MHPYLFIPAPRRLTHRHVTLDNLALVPASLLPYKRHWQRLANDLPAGAVLICLPCAEGRQRRALARVAGHLRAKGFVVAAVPSSAIDRSPVAQGGDAG